MSTEIDVFAFCETKYGSCACKAAGKMMCPGTESKAKEAGALEDAQREASQKQEAREAKYIKDDAPPSKAYGEYYTPPMRRDPDVIERMMDDVVHYLEREGGAPPRVVDEVRHIMKMGRRKYGDPEREIMREIHEAMRIPAHVMMAPYDDKADAIMSTAMSMGMKIRRDEEDMVRGIIDPSA